MSKLSEKYGYKQISVQQEAMRQLKIFIANRPADAPNLKIKDFVAEAIMTAIQNAKKGGAK